MSANTDWMSSALCAEHDPEIWFDGKRRKEARQICAECPVAAKCRVHGADEYRGVWGGEVHNRKEVGRSPSMEYLGIEHGTHAGYKQHFRNGTPPCGSCIVANRAYKRERELVNS